MKKIILTLTLLFACLNCYANQLRFAQVTDIHFSTAKTDNGSRNTTKTGEVLNWAIRSLNNKGPEFVVFMGDNTDRSNEDDIKLFLKTVKGLEMPYYIAYGNHDSYENSGVGKAEYWKLVKKYNKNNKSKYGFYSFSPNRDFVCIVLDASVPFSASAHGILPDEELQWLDKTLSKNKNKKALIFLHFPLIDPDDNPTHTLLYKDKYKAVLDKHDNIISISSGHFHIKKITIDEKGIYHIASPALVTPDYVYDIVMVNYDKSPVTRKVKIKSIVVKPVDLQ